MLLLSVALATATMTPMPTAPSGAPRMSVRISDLDLHTRAGAGELRRRVYDAVVAMATKTLNGRVRFWNAPNCVARETPQGDRPKH